jgi:hypothetical protein
VKRESDHRFEMKEECIHGVDGTLFEIAIFIGNVIPGEKHSCMLADEFSEAGSLFGEGEVFGVEGEAKGFNVMNESAGVFCESVNKVTFGGDFVSVFLGVRECSVSADFVRVTVKVGSTSVEGHLGEEGVDVVKRKELRSAEEFRNDWNDSSAEVGADRGVFFLFTVEVRECCVSCAERSDVFVDVWSVTRVFVVNQVAKERMKFVAGFRDRFSCSYNLFGVISERKDGNARFGKSIVRDVSERNVHVEFERFAFHVIRFFESIAGIGVVFTVFLGKILFDVGVSVTSLEASEIGVRVSGLRVESCRAEFGI